MLFTPATYGSDTPPPDQHPYAGFAFVEGETLRFGDGALERVRVQLGLVGPSAGGEGVQTNWHALTASEQPQGWDHQLRDEVTLGVSYDRTARTRAGPRFGRGAELLTAGGVALGAALTQAHISVVTRFGEGLRRDFGPPRVGAAAPGAAVFEPAPGLAWNVFAAGHARAVARNIALDGNTFADGPRVEREVFVFEAQTGLLLQRGAARAALVVTRRTREFTTHSAGQIFGGFTVSRAF